MTEPLTTKKRLTPAHPIQPLVQDARGVIRFKENRIVRHLLENGGIGLNDLAVLDFSQEDREQFAQLIGYSHSGSGDLGYVSDEVWLAAETMHVAGIPELEARNRVLRERLKKAQDGMRAGIAELFSIHPDDLENERV